MIGNLIFAVPVLHKHNKLNNVHHNLIFKDEKQTKTFLCNEISTSQLCVYNRSKFHQKVVELFKMIIIECWAECTLVIVVSIHPTCETISFRIITCTNTHLSLMTVSLKWL